MIRTGLAVWPALFALTACSATSPVSRTTVPAAPLVDHHQHLISPEIAALVGADGFGVVSADSMIVLLDRAGIERAVVASTAYMFGTVNRTVENEFEKVRAENDWQAAQIAKYPQRLAGVCGVNPLKDYALTEIERCAKDPKLKALSRGLKLHLGNGDIQLTNPEHIALLRGVFDAANRNNMAILIHMRAHFGRKRPYGPAEARAFIEEVLPAAPNVVIHVAHMAGTGPGYDDPPADSVMAVLAEAMQRKDARMKNVYFDVASSADADISPENAALLVQRIRQVGVERILYGSDSPAGGNMKPHEAWAAFRKLPLTDAEFSTIARNVAPYLR